MTDEVEYIVFLLRCLAEDEQVARATEHVDGPNTLEWHSGGRRCLTFDNGCRENYESVFAGNWARILVARDDGSLATHIAQWDPARVLAECRSKRAIVEALAEIGPEFLTPGLVLKRMTIPYADREGYRPEWKL